MKKQDPTFYADGTVEFQGYDGRVKRVTVEEVRAEDLATMPMDTINCIIDMVKVDE